jgi:predicted SprT family Zn-dependent metalloprotease
MQRTIRKRKSKSVRQATRKPSGNGMRQAIDKESPNRQYVTLSTAFDHFNRRLFDGRLPLPMITLQRRAASYGYYSAKRFEGRGETERETDEIALNPGVFKHRSDVDILATLVHEMVHHWQAHYGKPGRGRYHNHEWADCMEQLGLMPSDTCRPGGQRVGQHVGHYILAGGRFQEVCIELLAGGAKVEWQSCERQRVPSNSSKTKYTCPRCGLNAWAKPDVYLVCGDCKRQMQAEEAARET